MQAIIGLILIAAILLIGVAIGRFSAPSSSGDLRRGERRELEGYRDLTSELGAKAAEHSMLGDQFAVIVTGMLNDHRRAMKGRNA